MIIKQDESVTIVGFGSLARSAYPGLASMGLVAILGAVSTAVAAITVLPAYLAWARARAAGGIEDNEPLERRMP